MRTRSARLSLALALALGPALACQGKAGPTKASANAAPPLRLKTLEGEYFDLDDARGEVLLVNIWATWCEPCKKELPELARIHKENRGKGFRVIAVSVDAERNEAVVRRMANRLNLPFPVLLDPSNQSVVDWKVSGYPTTFVVSRTGEKLWERSGMIFNRDEELALVIENALAQVPPS